MEKDVCGSSYVSFNWLSPPPSWACMCAFSYINGFVSANFGVVLTIFFGNAMAAPTIFYVFWDDHSKFDRKNFQLEKRPHGQSKNEITFGTKK